MNKQPVIYMQTDTRWNTKRFPCTGGTMSIGGGGCGPTSAAMLIETLTGRTCPPTETMKWCCENGFVFTNQGTSYYAFKPLFEQYGIGCEFANVKCLSARSPMRQLAIEKLKEGYYLIALMTKGLWTSGGHYVVVWWADEKIRINDPASRKSERLAGDPDTFFAQAKYFWLIDARKYNKGEELDMTKKEFLSSLTGEECEQIIAKANEHLAGKSAPKWAESELNEAKALGITDGTAPMQLIPRYQAALMAKRAVEKARAKN